MCIRDSDKILKKGIYISPTIQTGYREIERLQSKEDSLTPQKRRRLDVLLYKVETKLEFVRRFHEMGVPIVMGTDAISQFGDYALGLQLLHRAGLTPMELVVSATSLAAKAIGMEDKVGTVKPGMLADLVYVDGDPLADVAVLDRVRSVVLNGQLVVDKRFDDRSIDDIPPIPTGPFSILTNLSS